MKVKSNSHKTLAYWICSQVKTHDLYQILANKLLITRRDAYMRISRSKDPHQKEIIRGEIVNVIWKDVSKDILFSYADPKDALQYIPH